MHSTSTNKIEPYQEFAMQQESMDQIYADPQHGLESVLQHLPYKDFQEIMSSKCVIGKASDRCTCCVDEGISLKDQQLPAGRYAGSGILLGEKRAKQLWRQNNITKVTAHTGCGAAKLYCSNHNLDTTNSDQIVADILKQWADDEGLDFEFITHLDRPATFHNARGVIVDSTEKLQCNRAPQLPHLFEITANMTAREVAEDIKLCFDIATGEHGLGQLITPEQPFIVGFVSEIDEQEKTFRIIEELNNDGWLENQDGRILIQTAVLKPSHPVGSS